MQTHISRLSFLSLLTLMITVGSQRAFSDAPTTAPTGPKMIMIIRHAEKPDKESKDPDLSKEGYARADALAKVIPDKFVKPDFLIATKRSKNSNRPVETIVPLSKAIHEEITAEFTDIEFDQLARQVLTDPKYTGKVVLISWHHGKIPDLAKALGVKDAPEKWKPEVFDRVWQITYENGVAKWVDLPQKAMAGDAQQ